MSGIPIYSTYTQPTVDMGQSLWPVTALYLLQKATNSFVYVYVKYLTDARLYSLNSYIFVQASNSVCAYVTVVVHG